MTLFSTAVPACPLCGSYRRRPYAQRDGGTYASCRSCGTVYVDPRPRDDWLQQRMEEFVPEPGGVGTWNAEVENERWKLDLLDSYRLSGKRLLDIGSGTGAFVAAANEVGYEAEGYDPAPQVAAAAGDIHEVTVHTGPLTDLDREYDVITLWDTLEHSPAPPELLSECLRLLVPGGSLMLQSPTARGICGRVLRGRWWVLGPTDHLVLPSAPGLRTALEHSGFEIVAMHTRQLAPFVPPEKLEAHQLQRALFRAASERLWFQHFLTARWLGDWLFAVASKPG